MSTNRDSIVVAPAPSPSVWSAIRESLAGAPGRDFTEGPIGRSIFILAVPMVLEMVMESIFAVVDVFVVAHLGVDTSRYVPQTGPREEFVFYPARGWPHKNHARLVDAVAILREKRPALRLVLTGGGLEALGPQPDWVEVRGLVPTFQPRSSNSMRTTLLH